MLTGHPSHTCNSSKNVGPGQGLARTNGPACSAFPSRRPAGTGTDKCGCTKQLLLSSRSSIGRTAI